VCVCKCVCVCVCVRIFSCLDRFSFELPVPIAVCLGDVHKWDALYKVCAKVGELDLDAFSLCL